MSALVALVASPQLLQLSGLGPGALLQQHGIEVVRDMQAVGSNLHDHFATYVAWRCTQPVTMNDLTLSLPRRLMAAAQYAFGRTGPLASMGLFVGALVRSDKRLERPDLQLNISCWSTVERTRDGIISHPHPGISISPVHLNPDGRGHVRLKSANPADKPAIQPNYLSDPNDIAVLLAGTKFTREIFAQSAISQHSVVETLPGPDVRTDDQLAQYFRDFGSTIYHPVGTCRMGEGPAAVVDPRLRVHGIEGLRVADASIMPTLTTGNTNAPTIMIGEKCAAMIKEDAAA